MNQSWFFYSVFATLCFGIGGALFKTPAAKKQNIFVSAFWSMGLPFILSAIFFFNKIHLSNSRLIWIAAIWAFFFGLARILYIESYHYADTNVVTPVTNTINIILNVATGLLIFSDELSLLEFTGVLLAFAAIAFFAFSDAKVRYSRNLLWLLGIIPFCAIGYKIFQKLGVESGNIYAFQFWQFGFATVFMFLLFAFFHKNDIKNWHSHLSGAGIFSGSAMGFLSFAGGVAYNIALSRGSFTLVNAIHSLYMPVTIFTAYLMFNEKFTRKKAILLLLSLGAILLIRLG